MVLLDGAPPVPRMIANLRLSVRRPSRRLLVLAAFLLLAGVLLGYAHWIEPNLIDIETVTLEIPGLSPALSELEVVFVTDLHVGDIGRREHRLLDHLKRLEPDLLLVGGDLVTVTYYMTGVLEHTERACSLLADVPTRYGTYAVWGNNDYPEPMAATLKKWGIRVLENEWVRLHFPGGDLTLAGLGDTITGRADWDATLDPPPPSPLLFLAHSPDAFPTAVDRGIPAMLVGHTHGGQVLAPFTGLAPTFFLRLMPGTPAYRAGKYTEASSVLYVSRGVGMSHVPFRFLCRPEITRVRLISRLFRR